MSKAKEILIEPGEYRGYKYEIRFASGDWGEMKEHFFSHSAFDLFHDKSLDCVRAKLFCFIDEWLGKQPQNKAEWLSMAVDCVITDSYEEWHIDEDKLFAVLEKYRGMP